MTYNYVSGGDLAKIDTSAAVYPLRDTSRGIGLYGVDIAYLLEHKAAWQRFVFGSGDTFTFTRKLSATQANNARPYPLTQENLGIVKPDATFSAVSFNGSDLPLIRDAYPDNFFTTSPDVPYAVAGGKLDANLIINAFAIAAQSRKIWASTQSAGGETIERTHYIDDHEEGLPPYSPAGATATFTHYYDVASGSDASGSAAYRISRPYAAVATPETHGIVATLLPFTAHYEYVETEGGQVTIDIEDDWCGYYPITATATPNASALYDLAPTILSARGYAAKTYDGGRGGGVWKSQRIRIDLGNSPIVIKRFSTRFDLT